MKQFIDPNFCPTVKSKRDSINLCVAGLFGNNLRMWPSVSSLKESNYRGYVAVRYYQPMSPYCKYNVPYDCVDAVIADFVRTGASRDQFFINEMGVVNCSDRLLQGEVVRSTNYLDLYYTYSTEPMRIALQKEGQYATGLKALTILKEGLDASSLEDLQAIWDIWPNAVVEFTRYRSSIGAVKGRDNNFRRETVFWEVREY